MTRGAKVRAPGGRRRRWPRPVLACGLAAGLIAIAGCGGSGVTEAKVEQAVTASFSRLYVAQQSSRGRQVGERQLRTHADCGRGPVQIRDPASPPASGAGDDWKCLITFDIQAGAPIAAQYSMAVRSNGCFTADGDGPLEVNGEAQLVTAEGRTVANPLWRFEGCFDLM